MDTDTEEDVLVNEKSTLIGEPTFTAASGKVMYMESGGLTNFALCEDWRATALAEARTKAAKIDAFNFPRIIVPSIASEIECAVTPLLQGFLSIPVV